MNHKKIIILSILLLAAAAGVIFLFSQHRGTPALNTVDIRIPLTYTQPLVIAMFDLGLSITPLEARAAARQTEAKNRFRYLDAYKNTDVVQTRLTNKLKEGIILKTPGHPMAFMYDLGDLSPYVVKKDKGGNLVFHDKALTSESEDLSKVFTIPAPYLIDAQGNQSSTQDVEMILEGNVLTLMLNPDWLVSHPYPIILDPTVEIHILNLYSHPQQGDNWEVSFRTIGRADLKISPADQATIDDDEFVSLTCDGEARTPQVLTGDVMYYKNWECEGTGKVIHYTLIAGRHHLIFDFGGQRADAYNAAQSSDPWWDTNWLNRRSITVATSTGSTLTNFPMAVHLSAGAWRTNIDYAKTQNSGQDVRFINYDGTALDYEIEKWDETATSTVWVEIPSIEAATTTQYFYMYYNNTGAAGNATTTGVWDANFKGVWHLSEDPSGTAPQMKDSTSNANDGTSNGTMLTEDQVAGQVDGSLDFDGSNDGVDIPSSSSLNFNGNVTLAAWVNPKVSNVYQGIIVKAAGMDDRQYAYYLSTNGISQIYIAMGGTNIGNVVVSPGWSVNEWNHIIVTADGTNIKIYINGVLASTTASTLVSSTATGDISIGEDIPYSSFNLNGIIDEVRISNVARSVDWIKSTYKSGDDSILTFGSEESVPASQSSVTDTPDPTNPNRSVTFSVSWSGGNSAKAKICKTDSLTSQNCAGGFWATSTAFTTSNPISVTYDIVAGDAGQTRSYYAFTCNDLGNCSTSTAGTFSVNAVSNVPDVKVRGGTKFRGGTVR